MRHYNIELKALTELYYWLYGFSDYKSYLKNHKLNSYRYISEWLINALPAEVIDLLNSDAEASFNQLKKLLASANEKYKTIQQVRRNEFLAFAEQFDTKIKEAIVRFLDIFIFETLFSEGVINGKVALYTDYNSAYRQILHLQNPVFSDNYDNDIDENHDAEIEVYDDNKYRISFIQAGEIVTVDFTGISIETQLLDYSYSSSGLSSGMLGSSLWSYIRASLNELEIKKENIGLDFLNEKEKALLPLCSFDPIHNFVCKIKGYNRFRGSKEAHELFINLAEQCGCKHIAELTKQYSNLYAIENRSDQNLSARCKTEKRIAKALHKALNKPSNEMFLMRIITAIKEATFEYPTEAELDITREDAAAIRNVITQIFKKSGYSGEYPHFKKMSSIKGIRLLQMHVMPVFVGCEKHMASMVDCSETSYGFNNFSLSFSVSTVFLKKSELLRFDLLNGRSGSFPHKDRQRARILTHSINLYGDEKDHGLEQMVKAVIKTAECEKLSKEERGRYLVGGAMPVAWWDFAKLALLFGGLFAIIFIPGLFLLGLLIGLPIVYFTPEETVVAYIRFLIFDIPWLYFFIFATIGFGLPTAIFFELAKKRG